MSKKQVIPLLLALTAAVTMAVIVIFCVMETNGEMAICCNGMGMFEKNSNRISLSQGDRLLATISGGKRAKLVAYLNTMDMADYTQEEKDDSFQYKLDCHNQWGVLYISAQQDGCYVGEDTHMRYKFPREAWDYLFQVLLAKK